MKRPFRDIYYAVPFFKAVKKPVKGVVTAFNGFSWFRLCILGVSLTYLHSMSQEMGKSSLLFSVLGLGTAGSGEGAYAARGIESLEGIFDAANIKTMKTT